MKDLNEYQEAAYAFASLEAQKDPILNGILGMSGETGECADLVKKARFQGHELNHNKLLDELGDVLWYISLTAKGLGVTLEEIATHNIAKLSARYPTGHFRSQDSRFRTEDTQSNKKG